MKKPALITALCFTVYSAFAQDTLKSKPYLNEFGMDATGFLKQFLTFGNQANSYYIPTYYLTYRRYFSCGNLRVQIGGSFQDNQILSPFDNDSIKYYDKAYSFYGSVGWELYTNLSKKWQVYYGADFRASIVSSNNEYNYSNGGYVTGTDSKEQIYGIAPFLGMRFKITKRLSILTEASFAANWEQDNNGMYYTPLPGATPPAPQNTSYMLVKMYSVFAQPLAVFIDFRL